LDFKEFDHSIRTERHPWELARIEVIIRLIKEFVPHDKSLQVLEIGCGDIFVLESLAEKFPRWSFVGTDISFPDSFLSHYKHERIMIYKNSEEAVNNIKSHIDLVLLLDVIEHVPDDVQFVKDIMRFSHIDGQTDFIITVPSFQWLFCSHDTFLQHYRRYTNNSLLALFRDVGLKHLTIGYFFGSLLFTRMIRVGLEKFNLIKPSKGLSNWHYTNLSSMLHLILNYDFKLTFALKKFGVNIPGLSNYAICRKSEL
jgi:hypothetical protein